MKVTTNELGGIRLEEVYNPVELVTNADEHLSICMRDTGYEMFYQGKQYRLNERNIIPAHIPLRRCGNTTRQVDVAIQTLFDKGGVYWWDHAAAPRNIANKCGFKVLVNRLRDEHNITTANGRIEIDKNKFWIKLCDKN